MLDLGESINVMPLSVFTSLSLGPLKPTSIVVQLANRRTIQLVGLLEDVFIKVNKLVFLQISTFWTWVEKIHLLVQQPSSSPHQD